MVTFFRRLPRVDFIRPKSLDEALNLLDSNHNGKYKIYAGGTDVIPKLKAKTINAPECLMDIKGIPELDYIDYDERQGLRIGALATIHSVAHSPTVQEKYPVLSEAAHSIASTQIQNRGTIVGNVCNAVPSADSIPALLCLGANLVCVSHKGERVVKVEDFFKGPNETILSSEELVKEIQIPGMSKNSRGVYLKLSPRSKMDLAVVGVATVVSEDKGIVQDTRIGLGAVAPTSIRARKAEDVLNGKTVNDGTIAEAAKLASEAANPIDDHRASAQYRRMMVEVLVKRAIHTALKN